MNNRKLFPDKKDEKTKKRGGPPNRMNDLNYSDWMKFQKSFFRYKSDQDLVQKYVHFFTKSIWPDGRPSKSLLIGFSEETRDVIDPPRIVNFKAGENISSITNMLIEENEKYDFIFIDFRSSVQGEDDLDIYLNNYANQLIETLRELLHDKRYCSILVDLPGEGGSGFPIPWAVGKSCRSELRLRDEKIGLIEDQNRLLYTLILQANDDSRPIEYLNSDKVVTKSFEGAIPGWIIPKPPPRNRKLKLHPAKFPETLIEEFIELFTKPGENVFDPMTGTGSTIIAAIRAGRNGYGIDLLPKYINTANERIKEEIRPTLFDEFNYSGEAEAYVGDSRNLLSVPEIKGKTFHYVITSPPYWSMLKNPGSEGQEERRSENLPLYYSDEIKDLGNVDDYDEFLDTLVDIYEQVAHKLYENGKLTVIVKNVKREHILYTLAWDLADKLAGPKGKYSYLGTTLWCQDDVGLKPFAVGIHWVSNTLHHYCIHFQKR